MRGFTNGARNAGAPRLHAASRPVAQTHHVTHWDRGVPARWDGWVFVVGERAWYTVDGTEGAIEGCRRQLQEEGRRKEEG